MKRALVIGLLVVLATAGLLEGIAYAGEKFVLRATLYRTKAEVLEVGDSQGHRLGVSDWIGVTFNEGGRDFLNVAHYVVKASSAESKAGAMLTGYKIFTMKDGSKAFARFEQTRTHPDGREGTFQFIEGTGRLEGLKGGGNYRVWVVAPGLLWDRLEGEYEIAR